MIDVIYFKEYRKLLGFTSKDRVKDFFAAKDIIPNVDYSYIELLNARLSDVMKKLNTLVHSDIKHINIDEFLRVNIDEVYSKLKNSKIINKLNNQGRRPEDVYYSWMRGFLISNYFIKAIRVIFDTDVNKISLIGDDDFSNIEAFKRTPKADLEITLKNNTKLRIEVQSGFQGINDIKQHKVIEAKKNLREFEISSLVIHFDLFNGQVAFVEIDNIEDDSVNWITRQQMEGQTVFNIDQNYFVWKLTSLPPKANEFLLG